MSSHHPDLDHELDTLDLTDPHQFTRYTALRSAPWPAGWPWPSSGDLMSAGGLLSDPGPSPQCSARSQRTGQRCKQRVPGGGVCRWHGRTRVAEAQRLARVAVAEARVMFGERYAPREWSEALPAAAQTVDQLMRALADRVELSGELRGQDVELLMSLADRVARLSKLCQDAGLDERRTQVSEAQAHAVVEAITGALSDFGIDARDPAVVRVLAKRLEPLRGLA